MRHSLSPQQVISKFQSPQKLSFISKRINQNQIKLSKKIYSFQTRNIKKFIRQQKQMELKMKRQEAFSKKNQQNLKKKYDQNQLLELQYKLRQEIKIPIFIRQKTRSQLEQQYSQLSNKNKVKSKILFKGKLIKNLSEQYHKNLLKCATLQNSPANKNRPKRLTCNQNPLISKQHSSSHDILPFLNLRKKSKTFQGERCVQNSLNSCIKIQQSQQMSKLLSNPSSIYKKNYFKGSIIKKQQQNNMYQSIGSQKSKKNLQNKSMINRSQDKQIQKLIEITQQKMGRYIRGIHTVANGYYEEGRSLDQNKVTSLVLLRYKIQNQQFSKKSESSSLTNDAIIPYMDLISQSQTRKTIHRIINMPIKSVLKMCFKLLDFNKNGLIDQKDLIYLIQLTNKIPQLRDDFLKICHYLYNEQNISISNAQSLSYRDNNSKLNSIKVKLNQSLNQNKDSQSSKNINQSKISYKLVNSRQKQSYRSHTYSTSEMTDFTAESKKKHNRCNTVSLDKQKMFLFLQSKRNFYKLCNQNNENFQISIDLNKFCKIFSNQRPIIFYDLLKYLFKIKQQDMIHPNTTYFKNKVKQKSTKSNNKSRNQTQFKNYNIPNIIKDMQNRFQCKMQISKYDQVLNVLNIENEYKKGQEQKQKQKQNQKSN